MKIIWRAAIPRICNTKRFKDRYWSNVSRGKEDECWPWTACTSNKYGAIAIYEKGVGPYQIRSHVVSFLLAFGELVVWPHCVCHRCDNPICCNPVHLFKGTIGDNIRDAASKGRWKNARRKVSMETASEIRSLYRWHSRTHGTIALAERFGINQQLVWKIVAGRSYALNPGTPRL